MSGLQPLAATRRSDGVFEQLRGQILSGAWPVGGQLPNERELAGALGVNRASVREALKRLEFLELVEVRHGQGTFVRELGASSALQVIETLLRDPNTVTRDLLRQLLEFRRQITLQIVELAARNRGEDDIARGRELLLREEAAAGDPQAALEIDLAMNALLGEATRNLMYQLVSNLFSKLVRRLGPLYYNRSRDHARSLETHRALLGALEAGDVPLSRRIVESMLDYSEEAIWREIDRLEQAGLIGAHLRRELS
jgi:GntR family transcriptional repressor for pyruvate dehydrogenase complex